MMTHTNDDISTRIKELYSESGYRSIRSWALSLNIPPTTLNSCVNGTEPRYSLLKSIIEGTPYLSIDWLMTGNGPKYRNQIKENINEELISLRAENNLLRELQGLGERKNKGRLAV